MRQTASMFLVVLFAALLVACGEQQQTTAPATIAPTASPLGDGIHTLLLRSGSVEVQRAGRQDSIPGRFGMVLRSGDLLQVADDAEGAIVCADLTLQQLAPGPGGVPCRAAAPQLFDGESRVQPARTGAANTPLQLVSPRKTRLLNNRPTIRWSGDPTAQYEVHVSGPGVAWSREVAGALMLAYPAEEAAMAAGSDYLIEVRSGVSSSEDDPTPGRGFTLLGGEQRAAIRVALARVEGLGLDERSRRLVAARVFLINQLYADALEELQAIPQADREPELQMLTGDIFVATDLPRLAEERYLAAEALAAQRGDLEVQALAELMVGAIYIDALGNKDEARTRFARSRGFYEELGDVAAVAALDARIAELK